MSETAPTYGPDARDGTCHAWRCRECGKEMWIVTGGDAWIDGKAVLPGVADKPVRVMCPHCGAWNEWRRYSN